MQPDTFFKKFLLGILISLFGILTNAQNVNLGISSSIVSENNGNLTVTAETDVTSSSDIIVNLSFSGTATLEEDYSPSANAITIPAGFNQGFIDITISDDPEDELEETIIIDIASVENGTAGTSQQVSATIEDNDPEPTVELSASSFSFSEDGGAIDIIANLSHATHQDITVTIQLENQTANLDDYNISSTQIVVSSGSTSGSVTFSPTDDTISEGPETVDVAIISVSVGASEQGQQTLTLTINDTEDNPTVTLSADPPSFNENGGSSDIIATLSNSTFRDITVTIVINLGTASEDDYSLSGTQIVVPAGNTSAHIAISGVDDNVSEGPEDLTAVISSISEGATEFETQSAGLVINDDEVTPTVTLSADPTVFSENGGSSTITATLTGETDQPVTVTINVVSGTASEADYELVITEISIPAGETTGTTSISGTDDSTSEGTEQVTIEISNVSEGATENGEQSVTLDITDDEETPTVTLTADPPSFSENGGSSTITATLSGETDQPVTVTINVVSGTASGADYELGTTEIFIPAGSTTGSTSITGLDDSTSEGTEQVTIEISNVSEGATENGEQSVTLDITDDEETPTVTIAADPASFAENESTTITATVNSITSQDVVVELATSTSSAEGNDFEFPNQTITITAGETSATTTISGVADALYEGDENLDVSISGVTSENASPGTNDPIQLTITDLQSPPSLSISADPQAIDEGQTSTLTISLNTAAEESVSVSLVASSNNAESADYSIPSETIIIPGESLSQTTTLEAATDNIYEGEESVVVSLSAPSGASATLGDNDQITVTINDLQSPPNINLSANPLTIGEDGISTITAQADVEAEEDISVTLALSNESANTDDYNLTSSSIVILAGELEGSTTLEGIPDGIYEGDETVDVSISALEGASAQTGESQTITITLSDDQAAPSVSLSASPASLNEGESSTITATLNTAASEDVSVTLTITDSETEAEDYSLSSNTIVIPAGSISGDVTLSIVSDEIYEGDESLVIDISDISGGSATLGSNSSVSITIHDLQSNPTITISSNSQSINEGETANISAHTDIAVEENISVDLSVNNITSENEDYVISSSTIVIPAGTVSGSVTLEATDDAFYEGDETVEISISEVSGGSAQIGEPQTISLNLHDNENAPLVTLSASPTNIPENGTSSLTASLSNATYENVSVTVSLSNGSIENDDLRLSSNTITIPAGGTSASASIEAIEDNLFEGNETFDIEITTISGGGSTEDGDQSVTIIINDDETAPTVTLQANPTSISEDGSSVLTVSLDTPTFEDVLVNLEITGGTAGTNDFNLTSGSVTIPAGNESASTSLDGLPDALYEGDENVTIEISAVAGGSATEENAQSVDITIEDAQTIPSASLELTGSPFSEDNGTAYVTVRLNHASFQSVQVDLLFGGTASSGDFSGATSTIEIPSLTTERTITLTGINDQEAEGDESITVSIESVTNGLEDGDQFVSATILDDDVVGIKPAITGGSTITSEAGTFDNFNVMLNTQPSSDVVIDITGVDPSEGTVSPSTLTFTPENWDENQIVTVTGVDDNEVDGDITYSLTLEVRNNSSDNAYNNLSTTVDVTNTDNDSAGFTLGITNSGTHTSESGDSDVFSLVLNSQPSSDVVFNIEGLDTTEGSLSTREVIFTPANWNQVQNITITGVDDDLVDGDITYTLAISVNDDQSDATYHGQGRALSVTNTDNDSAGISVSITGDNTQTSENGSTDSFDVILNSQPESDVVINLSGVDESEASISTGQLTFTTNNWNQPQTVKVTGVDDNIIDGNISYTITLTVDDDISASEYHGQVVSLSAINTDDDAANIVIGESDGSTVTSEDGTADSFDVSLTTQPASYVVIDIVGLDTSEGSLNTEELIFSPDNWDQPQTVTITGIDDSILDGDISYTINLSVDYDNSDDSYDGLTESVEVTNQDNEIENQAPIALADEFTMEEGTTLQGSSLLANDSDPDGDEININITPVSPPSNGTLEIFGDGTFTYQPDEDFSGSDSFEYEICDNRATQLCASATVTITVTEVDSDPDNDGIPTDQEGYGDADSDGIPNYLDKDSDNDGIPDGEENDFDCDNDGVVDRLDPDPCFKVKEAFSPNNDGINDGFVIPWTSQYDKVSLVIFNRWGSVVYSSDNYQNDWTGEASSGLSKGKGLPVGTYYYIVTIHDINKKISGYFYLNR